MLPRVGVRRWSAAQVLVASQVALSVLVLAIAALLVRSLYNLKTLDAGFERGNLLLFTMDTFGTPIRPEARADLYAGVLDRVRSLPGVRWVSGSTSTPVHTSGNARALHLPPHIQAPDNVAGRAAWMNFISPDYFQTLGIRVCAAGRSPTRTARPRRRSRSSIETMARFWAGDRDPVGMTLSFRGDEKSRSRSSASSRTRIK